jgi:hypothetical protein
MPTFDYPPSLEEFAVNAAEYLHQHPEYDVLCTGVAVFNEEGKLLLVRRAADEKAFPNMWVSYFFSMSALQVFHKSTCSSQTGDTGRQDR